jgi:putative membrane fusion protein
MKENDTEDKMKREEIVTGNSDSNAPSGKSSVKRLTFGSLLVLLFMLLYIPSLLNWLSGSTLSSDIIRTGTIEEAISSNALIIRNEELVKAPAQEGRCIADIGEGEKTPAFTRIATVLNHKSDTLLEEMEAVNARIVKARMEKAEKVDFFSEDIVKLDEEIGLKVQNLIAACNNRSFEDMRQSRHEIELIVEKKAEIVGESSTDSYIQSLKAQKETIQNKINTNTVQIVANSSGIVSYAIDGLEKVLKPDILETLTPTQFDEYTADYGKQQVNDGMAHAGKPLAKIIKGTEIFMTITVKTENPFKLKVNDKVKLRINDKNLEADGTIEYISKPDNGRSVVSIRTSRGADVLSSSRVINVEVIKNTEEGLKVPLKCLMNISRDGKKAEMMLIKANVAALRKVNIICRDKEFAIIRTPEKELRKTVNLYDTYIVNPEKVTEGDIVQK